MWQHRGQLSYSLQNTKVLCLLEEIRESYPELNPCLEEMTIVSNETQGMQEEMDGYYDALWCLASGYAQRH
jgi:hypothetical protein